MMTKGKSKYHDHLFRLKSNKLMESTTMMNTTNPTYQVLYQGIGATTNGSICASLTSGVSSAKVAVCMYFISASGKKRTSSPVIGLSARVPKIILIAKSSHESLPV